MKNDDFTKESKFTMYLDANDLKGWAASGCLPSGKFKWIKNVKNFDVNLISQKGSTGDVFEVDLEYPVELHYLHNDYVLALENLNYDMVNYDMLLNYYKKIADKYGIKVNNVQKLVRNLGNKNNYCSLQRSSLVFIIWNKID